MWAVIGQSRAVQLEAATMPGLWTEAGFPQKGWEFVAVADLKDDSDDGDYEPGMCEACGRDDLRYVHNAKIEERQSLYQSRRP